MISPSGRNTLEFTTHLITLTGCFMTPVEHSNTILRCVSKPVAVLLYTLLLANHFVRYEHHIYSLGHYNIYMLLAQIVPTEYRYLSKDVLSTNQYSVTEYFTPMTEFDRTWPGQLSEGSFHSMHQILYYTLFLDVRLFIYLQLSTSYMIFHLSL